jgi:hypothetical protein
MPQRYIYRMPKHGRGRKIFFRKKGDPGHQLVPPGDDEAQACYVAILLYFH